MKVEVQNILNLFIKKGLENLIQSYKKKKCAIHKTKDVVRRRQEIDGMTEIKKRIAGHEDYLKKQWKKEKRNSTRSVFLLQDINFEVSQVVKNAL